jgi:hypothetical protein
MFHGVKLVNVKSFVGDTTVVTEYVEGALTNYVDIN